MKIFWITSLLTTLFVWIPVTCSYSSQGPADQEGSGDDESSGSGLAEYEPAWVTDVPVMPTEQTTRIPVTKASYSRYTSVSQSIRRVATSSSLMDPEETTSVFKKGFASTVVEDYTTTISVKEDNRPTTDLNLNDKNTTLPHMKTMAVQTAGKTDVPNLTTEAAAKNTTILTTTEDKNVMFENTIISKDRANVVNSDTDSDFHFVKDIKPRKLEPVHDLETASGNTSLLERKEVLAGVVAGGVVGLMFSLMLVALMIYRMKKKDEGSYALEEHTHLGYQKPQKQMEFFA